MELNGKVAWVVGGSSGIGAAVARELVLRGSAVAISARRKQHLLDVAGEDMLALTADVTTRVRSPPRRRRSSRISARSTSR